MINVPNLFDKNISFFDVAFLAYQFYHSKYLRTTCQILKIYLHKCITFDILLAFPLISVKLTQQVQSSRIFQEVHTIFESQQLISTLCFQVSQTCFHIFSQYHKLVDRFFLDYHEKSNSTFKRPYYWIYSSQLWEYLRITS